MTCNARKENEMGWKRWEKTRGNGFNNDKGWNEKRWERREKDYEIREDEKGSEATREK